MNDNSDSPLEARLALLETRLAAAEGEAMFAGLLTPVVLSLIMKARLFDRVPVREALDALLLVLERSQAAFPLQTAAFEHARSRAEATLRPYLADPPERH